MHLPASYPKEPRYMIRDKHVFVDLEGAKKHYVSLLSVAVVLLIVTYRDALAAWWSPLPKVMIVLVLLVVVTTEFDIVKLVRAVRSSDEDGAPKSDGR